MACRLPIRPTPITPIRAFLLNEGISIVIPRGEVVESYEIVWDNRIHKIKWYDDMLS